MARTRVLQTIHTGKATYILLVILAVMLIIDYRTSRSHAFTGLKISGHTDELLHISKIKQGKALSYIENPYLKGDD